MITMPESNQGYQELWPDFSIDSIVRRFAEQTPDKPAVIDAQRGVSMTFAELDAYADRLAAGMVARGLVAGDVVGVQLPNWWEFVAMYAATSRLNLVICPISPAYRRLEMSHILSAVDVRLLVLPATYRGRDFLSMLHESFDSVGRVAGDIPCFYIGEPAGTAPSWAQPFAALPAEHGLDFTPQEPDYDSAHMILFTSGTESRPKGVVHSHNTSNYSLVACSGLWGVGPDDVVLVACPVTHGAGFNWCTRLALHAGSTQVLIDNWSGAAAADIIAEHGCTFTYAPTRFLQDLLLAARERAAGSPIRFSTFASGGSPIPRQFVAEAAELMGCTVLASYGQTECFVATSTRLDDKPDKISDTDGASIGAAEVVIVDEDYQPVAPGDEGVLITRGPHVAAGYLNTSTGHVEPFSADGWLWSGDRCVMDESGYIRVVGRVKEIIIRNGRNISPAEIEEQLLKAPEIIDVGVVGLPDELTGERIAAAVVLSDGASFTKEQMRSVMEASGLASFKFPEAIFVVHELPHSAVGKLQRNVLRDALQKSVIRTES